MRILHVKGYPCQDPKCRVRGPFLFLQTAFLLTSDSLCAHHSTGKKPAFADFAKSFAKEMSAAVNRMLNDFPSSDFSRWILENLGRAHFVETSVGQKAGNLLISSP
jgi:hypothetical protein